MTTGLPKVVCDPQVHVERGGPGVLERLADEWRDVLEGVSGDDVYSRPEWILARLRADSPKIATLVLTLRNGSCLNLLLPLVCETGWFAGLPVRKILLPLSTPGACNEIVMAPQADEDACLRAVWNALKSLRGWDVLELPSVYEGTPIGRLAELAEADGYLSGCWPLVPIPRMTLEGRDIAKLPPSSILRSRLRQAERGLTALGDLSLQCFDKADAQLLRRFYELEASGWKGKEGSAILCAPRNLQFFNEVAQEAQRFGYLRLYYLELNGKLISAHFGIHYRGRYYAPKIAYDENYRKYRVGHLLVSKIMRECAQQGVTEYSMGVSEEWKREWTKESYRRTFRCIFNKGPRGRLLFASRFEIRPFLKKLTMRVRRQTHGPLTPNRDELNDDK